MDIGEFRMGTQRQDEDNSVDQKAKVLIFNGGECGALIRAFDWSQTLIGPISRWPQSWRAVVNICLASHLPMIILWGPELIQIYNDSFIPLLGEKHPEAIGLSVRVCWPEFWSMSEPIYRAVLEQGETVYLENQLFPVERNGYLEEAYVTLCFHPIRNDEGGVDGILVTLLETTGQVLDRRRFEMLNRLEEEHKQAEEALRESGMWLRFALRAARAGSWEWDLETGETRWSPEYYALYGLAPPIKPSFENWINSIYPADRERVQRELYEQVRSKQEHDIEFRIIRPQQGLRWLSTRGRMLYNDNGEPVRLIGITIDITERKQAEIKLKEMNETLEERVEERTWQVRTLASALTLAEQRERHRIAQILHDDLQQLLYGLQLRVEILDNDAAAGKVSRVASNLEGMNRLISRAIQTARTLTIDLSPPVLQGEGLEAALAWLGNQMKELHDLEVRIESPKPCLVPEKDLRVLLYQLVRELLFNVIKHAGVNQATIICRRQDDQIMIMVEDKGKGFDLEAAHQRFREEGHFGLFSIRERLMLLGGNLEIETSPGQGTRVVITTPYRATLAARGSSRYK
jgi:PAS domain S-box-containing protein